MKKQSKIEIPYSKHNTDEHKSSLSEKFTLHELDEATKTLVNGKASLRARYIKIEGCFAKKMKLGALLTSPIRFPEPNSHTPELYLFVRYYLVRREF